jgi:hypothetical protein
LNAELLSRAKVVQYSVLLPADYYTYIFDTRCLHVLDHVLYDRFFSAGNSSLEHVFVSD